jgi:hypothetical protein
MSDWWTAVLIGVTFGLVIGVKIARDSLAKESVRGGVLAQGFHYLACAGLTGMLPFIITGLVVGLPLVELFGTAVGSLAVTAGLLIGYAVIEQSAPPAPDTGPTLSD